MLYNKNITNTISVGKEDDNQDQIPLPKKAKPLQLESLFPLPTSNFRNYLYTWTIYSALVHKGADWICTSLDLPLCLHQVATL